MKQAVLDWLGSYDTSLSSRFILSFMERDTALLAMDGRRCSHPLDPADLGRCIRLMDIEPSYRERIMEMAHLSPEWNALAAHWAELETLYHEEYPTGRAPRCYARMRQLLDEARKD